MEAAADPPISGGSGRLRSRIRRFRVATLADPAVQRDYADQRRGGPRRARGRARLKAPDRLRRPGVLISRMRNRLCVAIARAVPSYHQRASV